MKYLDQRGSSHIAAILAVVVVAAIGVVGYRVANKNSDTTTASTVSGYATTSEAPSTIKTRADVTKASAALDSTSIDTVNPDQLDSDLSSIL